MGKCEVCYVTYGQKHKCCKCPKVTFWVSRRGTHARHTVPQSKGGKVQYFEIKSSTIPNAGDDLFAMIDILPNVALGPYTGISITGAELDAIIEREKSTSETNYSRTAAYAFLVEGDHYIDAATETHTNYTRFINEEPILRSGT